MRHLLEASKFRFINKEYKKAGRGGIKKDGDGYCLNVFPYSKVSLKAMYILALRLEQERKKK